MARTTSPCLIRFTTNLNSFDTFWLDLVYYKIIVGFETLITARKMRFRGVLDLRAGVERPGRKRRIYTFYTIKRITIKCRPLKKKTRTTKIIYYG